MTNSVNPDQTVTLLAQPCLSQNLESLQYLQKQRLISALHTCVVFLIFSAKAIRSWDSQTMLSSSIHLLRQLVEDSKAVNQPGHSNTYHNDPKFSDR